MSFNLKNVFRISIIYLITSTSFAFEDVPEIPEIPSGRRSQFYLIQGDGGYKYGYDTGVDSAAKQSGSPTNEVEGHYFYTAPTGQKIDLKYTSGVQGFVPQSVNGLSAQSNTGILGIPVLGLTQAAQAKNDNSNEGASEDDQADTGDSSYSFTVDTDTYKRQESSDPSGNVQGKYSYSNSAGTHDLTYIAGSNIGFVATSGSLATPNGLTGDIASSPVAPTASVLAVTQESGVQAARGGETPTVLPNADGSYSFSYSTSDAGGTNNAGNQDLNYIGSGSGLGQVAPTVANIAGVLSARSDVQIVGPTPDGSYSYNYNTGDTSRQESLDAGNAQGRFGYTNIAGSPSFVPIGAPVPTPSGLRQGILSTLILPAYTQVAVAHVSGGDGITPNADGSYGFSYNTDTSSHQQSADPAGNVQGRFAYINDAGNHDLSYIAGSSGFLATGGSLAVPNGLGQGGGGVPVLSVSSGDGLNEGSADVDSNDDQPGTGDASYSFTIDTEDYKRQETADAAGNVHGHIEYKNAQGTHDLTFVAGAETGFQPTGGTLANAPGLTEEQLRSGEATAKAAASRSAISDGSVLSLNSLDDTSNQANTGDASYRFSIDTDEYKRQEIADASGNVQGSFIYKNAEGSHDLSFLAGPSTGFVATGGSLKDPPGLTEAQLRSGEAAARAQAQVQAQALSDESGVTLPSVLSSHIDESSGDDINSGDDLNNSGDASYNFNINTDTYSRQESSDAAGNVQASYSYTSPGGSHTVSFVSGSSSGFQITGGAEAQVKSGATSGDVSSASNTYLPPQVPTSRSNSYNSETASVRTYLPPGDERQKFGYIYDTQ